jgi:hypothetical protein
MIQVIEMQERLDDEFVHVENARGLRISPDSTLQHAPLWEWCEDIKKI